MENGKLFRTTLSCSLSTAIIIFLEHLNAHFKMVLLIVCPKNGKKFSSGPWTRGLIPGGLYPGGLYPAAYIRGITPGGLYPGAYIRGHISRGLIYGAYIWGAYIRGFIPSATYPRGLLPGDLYWGAYIRGFYLGLISGGLLSRGLEVHTDIF